MENNIKTLEGKLVIKGKIKVKTGMMIGGNSSGIDIGALDNPVIKTYKGLPYIPGSSLKGKMRALLARVAGSENVDKDEELMNKEGSAYKHLARVFGFGNNNGQKDNYIFAEGEALLKVRDAYLESKESDKNSDKKYNQNRYTEEKMENTIDRLSGKANPRTMERVIPETVFVLDLCLDIYDKNEAEEHVQLIKLGIDLLNQDYLGGSGTRGYGRVEIIVEKNVYYEIKSKKLSSSETNFVEKINKILVDKNNENSNTKTQA